jgi:ribosomal protein S18 acetylase RimI-like enzyme
MSLTIRECRPEDEREWLQCHALVYLGSNERRMQREKQTYGQKAIELVSTTDGKIVGFADVELEATPGSLCQKKAEGNGMLWDLGVLPEFRRRGCATRLLGEAITQGSQLGMKRLEAWSIEPDAWKFYEKYGFKRFFEYHHVLMDNREKLRAFDRNGLHVVEVYAHVMPGTDLQNIFREYAPKEVLPCCGFELVL